MRLRDMFLEAVDSVRENRVRTVLMVLGLVIGIGSVITVVGVGEGAKVVISDILSGYGDTSLIIMPNWGYLQQIHWVKRPEEITREDIDDIRNHADAVKVLVPWVSTDSTAERGRTTETVKLVGTMPSFMKRGNLSVAAGRTLGDSDVMSMAKAVVIGSELAEKLFPAGDALGRWITLHKAAEFQVVGVLNPGERNFLSRFDDGASYPDMYVFIPYSTIKRLTGSTEVYELQGEAMSVDRIEEARKQIMTVLNRNHGKWNGSVEKYIIIEAGSIIETINAATGSITLFISLIAAISLFVAGVGIMNIMLVSVKERTREIGVRKALGAPAASILNQFILETLLLCGSGGLLGTVVAAAAITLIGRLAEWPALIDGNTVILAISLSILIGLIFGLLPAGRAADMDPVEALRYE